MEMTETDLINSPKAVLAIDPGLSGAAFKLGRGGLTGFRDFKALDEISFAIKALCEEPSGVDFALIEDVHAMPGQGVCSMFSFGKSTGYAESALVLCLKPGTVAEKVSPQRWQNFFRKLLQWPAKAEFDSRSIAARLFPTYSDFFTRKKDHNSADAVLMAAWKLASMPQQALCPSAG